MRPTKVIVDLNKISSNVTQLKKAINNNVSLMSVVKANAYGHGSYEVAKQCIESGSNWLGVALPFEGAELREQGIKAPILVLGGIDELQIDTIIDYNLSLCVFSKEILYSLNKCAKKKGKIANVHLKIDTGMGRLGVRNLSEAVLLLDYISDLDNIKLEGIFTHFSSSDEQDIEYTKQQIKIFGSILCNVKRIYPSIEWIHSSNTAAIINYPDAHYNLVRAGIGLYGYYPSSYVRESNIVLKPALSWYTKIVYVKRVRKGDYISYGRTFQAKSDLLIATLPVGYADGYNRLLSNNGRVIINGQYADVVGRVCMDQIMIDISHVINPKIGSKVTLLGNDNNLSITADDIAYKCNTIAYEILTNISYRVPREYIKG